MNIIQSSLILFNPSKTFPISFLMLTEHLLVVSNALNLDFKRKTKQNTYVQRIGQVNITKKK